MVDVKHMVTDRDTASARKRASISPHPLPSTCLISNAPLTSTDHVTRHPLTNEDKAAVLVTVVALLCAIV